MASEKDSPGLAYITMVRRPDGDSHYLNVMADGKFHQFLVDGRTLCRLATEAAHYLPKFIPGAYAHTPGEIHDNTDTTKKE
jgi:hypothetical protein